MISQLFVATFVLFLSVAEGGRMLEAPTEKSCWVKFYDQPYFGGQEQVYYESSNSIGDFKVRSLKSKPGCVAVLSKKVGGGLPEEKDRWRVNGYPSQLSARWEGKITSYDLSRWDYYYPVAESEMNCRATLYDGEYMKGTQEQIYKSKNVKLLTAKSLKLSKGCCVTIFTGKDFAGFPVRVCESQPTFHSLFKNKVRSIRMEQRPYPTCRIELMKTDGTKEVYGTGKSDVSGISSYKVQSGCKARFFTQTGFKGTMSDSPDYPGQVRSFLLLLPPVACRVGVVKKDGDLYNKKYYAKQTEKIDTSGASYFYVEWNCVATVFSKENFQGTATRLSQDNYKRILSGAAAKSVKSFLIEQV